MGERTTTEPRHDPMPARETGRAVALALLAGALYLATLAPGLLWGDDAELQRLALGGAQRSDAHGHPLWFALARFVAGVPMGSIAWRMNVLSAVCAALAVGVLYATLVRLTRRRGAAAIAATAFAVSHTHWMHAVRTEVYALFVLLLAGTLLLFAGWRRDPRPWRLVLMGAVAGLALLSHLLVVTALPGITLGVACASPRAARIRNVVLLLGGWLAGFAVFVGVSGVAPLLRPAPGGGGVLTLFTPPGGKDLVRCAAFAVYQFPLAWPWVAWGLWRAWREDAPVAAMASAVALGALGFALCLRVPDQYVFFLPAYLALAIFLAFGLRAAAERWPASRIRGAVTIAALVLAPPALYRLAPAVATAAHLSLVTPRTLPGRDNNRFFMFPPKRGEHGAERYARGAFAVLPESALVVADWAPLEPLKYLQEVESLRPDVTLVESAPYDTTQLGWIVEQSLNRPVFVGDTEPPPYYDLAGLERHFELRAVGPLFQLVPHRPE